MKKYLFMAVAAIAVLSSCSNEDEIITNENSNGATTFFATMEGDPTSRVTLNGNTPNWEAGDVISIDGNNYTADEAGERTTFTGTGATAYTHLAYFPARLYNSGTPILPAIQTYYQADNFNMPMYATSNTTDLKFKNLCGVLKITVKNDQIDAVKSITLSSANKALSGSFTVNANNAAVLDNPDAIDNISTIIYRNTVSTDAAGKVFYVAVPAQTYQELKIGLTAADGINAKIMTTKAATDITVDRNKIYPITFVAGSSYAATFSRENPTTNTTDYTYAGGSITMKVANAKNNDVKVQLTLSQTNYNYSPCWDTQTGLLSDSYAGKLTVTVTPQSGVTVQGISLRGYNSQVTKTGSGPWDFTLDNYRIFDGTTQLGDFESVTVSYTK